MQDRCFSISKSLSAYSDTVSNLQIGEHTRVIFQGFTGRQVNLILISFKPEHLLNIFKATQNARQSIDYGTKIVGGVTPGKNTEHLGLPVLPSVQAVSRHFALTFTRNL